MMKPLQNHETNWHPSVELGAGLKFATRLHRVLGRIGLDDIRIFRGLAFVVESEACHAGVDVTCFASAMGVSRPTAYEIIRALESRNVISRRRDPENRRRTLVELTDEGHDVMHKLDRECVHFAEQLAEAS